MATHNLPGELVVIDGLDGVGKGVAIDALVKHEQEKGRTVFDVDEFSKEFDIKKFDPVKFPDNLPYPSQAHWAKYDILKTSEPTYALVGEAVRKCIIAPGSTIPGPLTAEGYGLDRAIHAQQLVIPARAAGKDVFQSRSFASSLAYQVEQIYDDVGKGTEARDFILHDLFGNRYARMHCMPSLLIIPTIKNPEDLMERLKAREKQDKAKFESLEFQLRLKPHYESDWMKEVFEKGGTVVRYIDAGISVEETRKQAVSVWEDYLASRQKTAAQEPEKVAQKLYITKQ